ncbi:MAG: LicD family protein [Gemmatimonadetes bacterium]|nr:LicD family protein [Gemmatimonadota bacterium]
MDQAKPDLLLKDHMKVARTLLFDVIDLLEANDIAYHLEGGTLLGIVRDGDLLPWDHDVDLSVPEESGSALLKLRAPLLAKGYRFSVRRSRIAVGPIRKGALWLCKVKPLYGYFRKAIDPRYPLVILDIFVKIRDAEHTYWRAKGRAMRVANRYYSSYETITFAGRTLRVPNDYRAYLTEKYGDWSVPVRNWSCDTDELTVLGRTPR